MRSGAMQPTQSFRRFGEDRELCQAVEWIEAASPGTAVLNRRRLGFLVLVGGLLSSALWGAPQSDEYQDVQRESDAGMLYRCDFLGMVYAFGAAPRGAFEGARKDPARAVPLFQKACHGGDAEGCGHLADLYADGRGVPKDAAKALYFYQEACDRGSADNCHTAGGMLATGEGRQRDNVKAAELYRKACDGVSGAGCSALASMYARGEGVQRDSGKAGQLYRKGCDNDDPRGCNMSGGTPKATWSMLSMFPQAGDMEHFRPLEKAISQALLLLDKQEYDEVYRTLASPNTIAKGEKEHQTAAGVADIKERSQQYIKALVADLRAPMPQRFTLAEPPEADEVVFFLVTGDWFFRIGDRWYLKGW